MESDALLFGRWKINDYTWCITDSWRSFLYLIVGTEKALLIDTGGGEGNLRSVVEKITDRPVMVANTHGHFDHTGGNPWWSEAWMTKEAEVYAKSFVSDEYRQAFYAKPYPGYQIHHLQDGQVIDLGEIRIEVLAIPAHSEGSVAFLDPRSRFLFSGDEILSSQVLCIVRNQAVSLREFALCQKANMEKLKKRLCEFAYIWPSHNGLPLSAETYIEAFLRLDCAILDGTAQKSADVTGFGFSDNLRNPAHMFYKYGKLYQVENELVRLLYAEHETDYRLLTENA